MMQDNVYAREVSLHDLNAIHEGVGLEGPLQVTLHSVIPRFIARYNYLREHLAALSLGVGHSAEDHEAEGSDTCFFISF